MTRLLAAALLLGGLCAAQDTLRFYDVRDLLGGEHGTQPDPAPTMRDLIARIGGDGATELKATTLGTIVVRGTREAHDRVRRTLDGIRTGSDPEWALVAIVGELRENPFLGPSGDPPEGPVVLSGWEGMVAAETDELVFATNVPEQGTGVVGPAPIRLYARDGHRVRSEHLVELQEAWLGRLRMTPLRPEELALGARVRFVTSYRIVQDVEGHPDGLAVPQLSEVRDGAEIRALLVPSGGGAEPESVRVHLEARVGRVRRPVPTLPSPNGPVHVPESEERTVVASVSLRPGTGIAVPLGTWEHVLVLRVTRRPR